MPIYEYQCQACEHKLEALQKMADAPLTRCPACEQDSLKKLISAAAFKLKGSGWYETDFKNSSKPQSGTQGGSDAAGGSGAAKDGQSSSKPNNTEGSSASSSGGADKAAS